MLRSSLATVLLIALTPPILAQPRQPDASADPSLALVPSDSFGFVSVKVSKLWDNPAAKPFRDWAATQKDGLLEAVVGVPFADIDRVTVFVPVPGGGVGSEPITLVTTRERYTEAKLLKALGAGLAGVKEIKLTGRSAALPRGIGPFRTVVLVNDRTLAFSTGALPEQTAEALRTQLTPRKAEGILSDALSKANAHDIVAGINVVALEGLALGKGVARDKEITPYLVLLKARTAVLTADVGQTAKGKLVMAFPDADTAKLAAPALEDGMMMIAGGLAGEFRYTRDRDVIPKLFTRWALRLWKSTDVKADGSNVVVTGDVAYADELPKLVAALPKSLKHELVSVTTSNNLKQLGLAMHNYESAYTRLPSDVMPGENAIAMSWRVQILPFIEQDNLHRQLDHTKPWDDAKNLKALQTMEMPKVFEHPGRTAPKGHTYFRVLSYPKNAKGTDQPLFREGQKGPSLVETTDGTSNTFMIVEAREAVPWYKPDVLAYDGKLPLPGLGDKDADEFFVVFADGSVRKLKPSKLAEDTLRALITKNGGEIIPNLVK